ncbi:MAG: sulfatase-like hydrolase/transferase [Lachnospiraceae bacterium]|nr:sulfatase-like hydrolase/transferase [Lachnospiraceae bacterium]
MGKIDFIDLDFENSKAKENDFGNLYDESFLEKFKRSILAMLERFLYFSGLLLFFEISFHLWAFKGFTSYAGLLVLMVFPLAIILSFLTSFFPRIVNRILVWLFTIVGEIFVLANILYFAIFKVFFSIQLIEKTNMKFVQYYREIIAGIAANWWMILLCVILPNVVLGLLSKFKVIKFRKASFRFSFFYGILLAIFAFAIVMVIPLYGKDEFSAYSQIHFVNTPEVSINEYGVFGSTEIDLRNLISPREEFSYGDDEDEIWVYQPESNETSTSDEENPSSVEEIEPLEPVVEEPKEPEIDRSPNILDLDFVAMAEKETDEFVQGISNYLATVEPSNKNEYTGMFEGFNLIFMTAEGFSTWAIDENLTPTLYRLTHEGIVCNNFYNPRTGGSTSDGEFVCSTSLYPVCGGAKNFRIVGQNSMPLALGNMFNMKYGITSRAYHDNDYTYYGRDISYPSMGYYYQGMGNGLEIEHHWPASDKQMIEASLPEFIDDDLFHVYYMTVSGHLNYNFSGNWCSKQHMEEVADLPYSEPCRAYIACQMEFDQALEYLIEQLEEKGIADKTVICFTGDHWPYGLTNEEISEFMDHPVEENFELFKSSLVLWSEAIEEPIYIDKVCGSMDILPTLLNLFGFDYDSRLLMGRDILSDTEGFVMFINRSFMTDKISYNSLTKEVINLTDEEVDEDYISACKKKLSNKWKYSERIMTYDYYQYVCDELGIELPIVEQNYIPDYSKFQK